MRRTPHRAPRRPLPRAHPGPNRQRKPTPRQAPGSRRQISTRGGEQRAQGTDGWDWIRHLGHPGQPEEAESYGGDGCGDHEARVVLMLWIAGIPRKYVYPPRELYLFSGVSITIEPSSRPRIGVDSHHPRSCRRIGEPCSPLLRRQGLRPRPATRCKGLLACRVFPSRSCTSIPGTTSMRCSSSGIGS